MELIQTALGSGVSPETLDKLMELQQRYEKNQARKDYNRAMVTAQAQMPTVFKSRENSGTRSTYASYDDIMRVIRPGLSENGFAISFNQTETADTMTLSARIMHRSGHSETTEFTLPKDEVIKSKAGNNVTNLAQAQGAANSYAKRYCLCNALNIVNGDQDDDAKAMDQPVTMVDEAQSLELRDLCGSAGVDDSKFLAAYKADSFDEIALVFYAPAKAILERRITNNRKEES